MEKPKANRMATYPDSEHIKTEVNENQLVVEFNRPEKRNALTKDMYRNLLQSLKIAEVDDEVKSIIITGTKDCFTSGNDLSDFRNVNDAKDLQPVSELLYFLPQISKPLIAAITGHAVGIGTTILLHCDLAYAEGDAIFQLPFVKLGLCPEAASSLLLPKLVGHQKAAELLLLGEAFDSKTAEKLGLINQIITQTSAIQHAKKIASKLNSYPQNAITLTKSLLKKNHINEITSTIKQESEMFYQCLKSADSQNAISRFFRD